LLHCCVVILREKAPFLITPCLDTSMSKMP
jgi:hypothetical protein